MTVQGGLGTGAISSDMRVFMGSGLSLRSPRNDKGEVPRKYKGRHIAQP
jgi:hypothetical protein